MKLIEKIQKVRLALQEAKLKMTGRNRTFEYFELDDFLPTLNKLMADYKMTAIPSFGSDLATLTAYDFESEDTVIITSPMGSAKLAGCHEVQNIGAVETYQRRYLYQAMFDINDKDMLDGNFGKKDNTPKNEKINDEQPEKTVICDRCGSEIKPVKKGGKIVSAEEIKKSCNGLCIDCYKEEATVKEVEVE